jgi:FSR family fosmidomycin resistance protein-like MFS transporter
MHTKSLPVVYGIIHALIDASCAALVFGAISMHSLPPFKTHYLILTYNTLAFGTQVLCGLLTDRLRAPRLAALSGIVLTAVALLFAGTAPIAAAVIVGMGNAFFHVGAGAITLFVTPGRAKAPGIFVGPGALGLAIGIWIGKNGYFTAWPFILALVLSYFIVLKSNIPQVYKRPKEETVKINFAFLIITCLFISIIIRSLVGFAGGQACPKSTMVSFGLATAAFAGKTFGGIISDRFGWIKISVGALLLSSPLIALSKGNPAAVISGMCLFQMTMPVTLVAIVAVLPKRPAFAFGLTCLALIIGAYPSFFNMKAYYAHPYVIFGLILISAALVYLGLRLLPPKARNN